MKSLKTKTTNKKFYNKWLYKTTLRVEGSYLFRNKSLEEIKEFCNGPAPAREYYALSTKAYANKDNILKVCNFLEKYNSESYKIRVEQNCIDFYTNDKDFYEDISSTFESMLEHCFEPSESSLNILEGSDFTITVKKLPKNIYNYRVYLLPHKLAKDNEAKESFISWLKGQVPKVTCTPAIESWFIKTDWNWDRRYILVDNENTLLMLKLRNSEAVGRVYKFIVSDK